MTVVNIMVGGPEDLIPYDQLNHYPGVWLGVDLGATRLLNHGIVPVVALGDFDSSTNAQFDAVVAQVADVRICSPIKDETDTQLALTIALQEYNATQINLFGATGGRLDQLLANLYSVLRDPYRLALPKLRLIDTQNVVTWFEPGTYQVEQLPTMQYLAFVGITGVDNLTIQDAKYNLAPFSSAMPISWSSNEFVGQPVTFSFTTGIVMVIQSRD